MRILYCYTFSCVCLVITSTFWYLYIHNEFVMNHYPLTAVFAADIKLLCRIWMLTSLFIGSHHFNIYKIINNFEICA